MVSVTHAQYRQLAKNIEASDYSAVIVFTIFLKPKSTDPIRLACQRTVRRTTQGVTKSILEYRSMAVVSSKVVSLVSADYWTRVTF